ncbi:MAG: NADH-quinone oxidoreductase subunit NuoE [Deltaproteobacteria bacterium]|nr:NADH-quinone oxidoreductase subunit NuoE [Deltaproteobacteria bacterium]
MLSNKVIEDIKKAIQRYPNSRSAAMAALRIAQEECEYVTEEAMREIAEMLDIPPVDVHEVVAFYTMYNKRPVGKYHIQVCRNISCSLLGAEHLKGYIEKMLNIKVGETTPDNMFTLSTVECLGSCGTSPVMQINEDYYENLTEERVEEVLKGLR